MRQAVVVTALVGLLAAPAAAAPGDLDRSFGGDGIVFATAGTGAALSALAIERDAIVGAGSVRRPSCSNVAIARWRADGALARLASPLLGPCDPEQRHTATAHALALGPDGRAFTGGSFLADHGPLGLVTAHTASGALDASFGASGQIRDAFANGGIRDLVRLPDGRLVAAGDAYEIGRNRAVIHRYLPDGRRDGTFGARGEVDVLEGRFAALVADGAAVVAAGEADRRDAPTALAVARVGADGALDAAFGEAGQALVAAPGGDVAARDLAGTGDGGFVVAAAAWPNGGRDERRARWLVAKLDSAGRLVPAFGSGGLAEGPAGVPAAMAVDRAGRLIVVGDSRGAFAVARFLANGAPDPAFGERGVARVDVAARATAVAIQADGRIVVGGTTRSRDPSMVVARLLADEPSRPSVRIVSSRVTSRGVLVRVTWPRGTDGTVRARLWTRDKSILLGQRTVAALPGTRGRTFRVPLNARAKSMLRGGTLLKVRATVLVTGLPTR